MSEQFNTPPAADLTALPTSGPPFYTVSLVKLTVMMFITCGLYGLYWYYKNWSRYKAYSAKPIWPVLRTIFGLIYVPSMFGKVDALLKEKGQRGMPYWGTLAAGMILLALAPSLVVFVHKIATSSKGVASAGLGLIPLAISVISTFAQFLIMLRVQSFINQLNRDAEGSCKCGSTFGEGVWAMLGLMCWVVVIIIAVMIETIRMYFSGHGL